MSYNKSMAEKKLTRAELSRELKVSRSAITQAVKIGKLKLDADFKITLSEAKKQLKDNSVSDDSEDGSLIKYKTEVEKWKAKQAELDYRKDLGELISKTEVEEQAFLIGKSVKEEFLSVIERLYNQLAAETDPLVVRGIMSKEFKVVLDSVSKNFGGLQ